jgi:hypothetical protein
MADLFTANKLILFLLFFVPGFISIKIYDLLVPGVRRDFSKSAYDAISYSAINYALWSWLIVVMIMYNAYTDHFPWFVAGTIVILVISPIVLPIVNALGTHCQIYCRSN